MHYNTANKTLDHCTRLISDLDKLIMEIMGKVPFSIVQELMRAQGRLEKAKVAVHTGWKNRKDG